MNHNQDSEFVASKRAFLLGRKASVKQSIAPPWAEFISNNCISCGDCIDACPESILTLDTNHLPTVNFDLGECTFCGECADICKTSVFIDRKKQNSIPWNLAVNISKDCFLETKVYCRSCGDTCPERAINFKLKLKSVTEIEIDQELCSGCGACVASCPKSAVSIYEILKKETI